jgi:hypothetical protein
MKFCLALLPGLLALSACQAGASAKADSGAAVPAEPAASSPTPDPSLSEAITVQCGGTDFLLRLNGTGGSTRAALLMGPANAAAPVDSPAGMADYDPVGIACVTSSKTGGQWLAVQYGEAGGGCGFCEWNHLYDAQGRALTRSVPPILVDGSLPPAQQQSPNNRDFSRLSEELQLERPDFRFLPRK